MTLAELKAKYNAIAKDMRALNDTIGDNDWSDEQRTSWKKMKGDLDALNTKIEREEELRERQRGWRFLCDSVKPS